MGLCHCVGMCYVFCTKVRGCICCVCVVFECMLICCIIFICELYECV